MCIIAQVFVHCKYCLFFLTIYITCFPCIPTYQTNLACSWAIFYMLVHPNINFLAQVGNFHSCLSFLMLIFNPRWDTFSLVFPTWQSFPPSGGACLKQIFHPNNHFRPQVGQPPNKSSTLTIISAPEWGQSAGTPTIKQQKTSHPKQKSSPRWDNPKQNLNKNQTKHQSNNETDYPTYQN